MTLHDVRTAISRTGRVPLALLLLWAITVWWGEHSTFAGHTQECVWNNWESWKEAANPHHVLLVADPQLVDPHTYPDRPWPLSFLTVLYTDLYLRRAYRSLLRQLQPHSTVFLGDLFDGGREWGTRRYSSPDPDYKQYGQDFWLQEYERFQNMFVKEWHDAELPHLPGDEGRRLIVSLPGNHDLGFGGGINAHVKSRFDAHFGPLNRIDMLGNHTFISLDTVSLSAMDQVDPLTGAFGTGDGSAAASKSADIWKPVENFLNEAKTSREHSVKQEIRRLGARSAYPELRDSAATRSSKLQHGVNDLGTSREEPQTLASDSLRISTSLFPTIVLSHVPLFRPADKSCGPQRERGTAIPIATGYQYQNVLTPLISKDIIQKLDASQVTQIYGGDDHDYCEVEHDEFTGRIREITVKSVSWAMGVRRPGVQLVSLWNPVDLFEAMIQSGYGVPTDGKEGRVLNMPRGTVQNHLCLLPDQLSIFICYGELLGMTLISLLVRALMWKPGQNSYRADPESDQPLLPLSRSYTNGDGSTKRMSSPPPINSSATTPASVTSRRGGGQLSSYDNLPSETRSRSASLAKMRFTDDSDDWGNPTTSSDRVAYAHVHHDPSRMTPRQRALYHISSWWAFRQSRTKVEEFIKSLLRVSGPAIAFYVWLIWRDM